MQHTLRAWTLGPLPSGAQDERWSLSDELAPPDDACYVRRRASTGAWAVFGLLLVVLGFAVVRGDPLSRGWRDPAPALTRVLEPGVERLITALATALGGPAQSPRGSSSGR